MIVPLLGRGGDLVTRADVCVIGSGAGGAVAAAELAEAGRDVVVLEQGGHWTRRDFTQREDEMMPRLFEEGAAPDRRRRITILQGRNVGGSTVHNLCYCFRTPDPILRMWRDEHALPELTRGRARRELRARRSEPAGEADPRGRGQHAQQQDPRGLREARLLRLRHATQPREAACSPASACSAAPSTPSRACSSPTSRARAKRARASTRTRAPSGSRRRRRARARVDGHVVDHAGARGHAQRRGARRRARRGRHGVARPAAAQRARRPRGRPQPAPAPVRDGRGLLPRTSTPTAASRRATTSTSSSISSAIRTPATC